MASENMLSAEQMARFVMNGYLALHPTSLSPAFHAEVLRQANRMEDEGCNNCLGNLPMLQEVCEAPEVVGALTSVLGEGYIQHGHHAMHKNDPGSRDQIVHKDSYFGYTKHRLHAPWWAMIMYYPQRTKVDMGPTSVVPGSQYHMAEGDPRRVRDGERTLAPWNTKEVHFVCEEGTVLLFHYDLFHRGTANVGSARRWMFKFQFMRMHTPRIARPLGLPQSEAGWVECFVNVGNVWGCSNPADFARQRWRVWAGVCEWLMVAEPVREAAPPLESVRKQILEAHNDSERVAAAYALPLCDGQVLDVLSALLKNNDEAVARSAMYSATLLTTRHLREGQGEGVVAMLLRLAKAQSYRPSALASHALAHAAGWEHNPRLAEQVVPVLSTVALKPTRSHGLLNAVAEAAESLGCFPGAHRAIAEGVRRAARAAPELIGNQSMRAEGEVGMAFCLAALRALANMPSPDRDLIDALLSMVGSTASITRPPHCAERDHGLRYSLSYSTSALAHFAPDDIVAVACAALEESCRLPAAPSRKALVVRRCHLTTQRSGY